jgi:TRAP-type C4-dicarboxylate transport system substrate-binding protein
MTLALVFIGGILGAVDGEAKSVTVKVVDHSPPKGLRAVSINYVIEKVEEQTNGEVKFQTYWAGSLLKIREMVRGISEGVADMAWMWPPKHPTEYPAWQALAAIVVGPKDLRKAVQIGSDLVENIPAFRADFEKWNTKPMGYNQVSGGCLFMNKPIETIWDLKGMKVRSPDPPHLAMLAALGATPVYIPMADTYSALQRGAFDGVFTFIESGHRFKFHEVTKYIYPCTYLWAQGPNVVALNIDTWNKISKKNQKIFSDVCQEMGRDTAVITMEHEAKEREDFKKAGCQVRDIPKQDLIKWSQMPKVVALQDQWVEKANEAGLPANLIMSRVKEIVSATLE